MPTILRIDGYRFYFYSHEPDEPPHVHVDKAEATGKVWLGQVEFARQRGFRSTERTASLSMDHWCQVPRKKPKRPYQWTTGARYQGKNLSGHTSIRILRGPAPTAKFQCVPTILRIDGYRFYFYSHEPNEPPHVHVDKAEATGKVWLGQVEFARQRGFRSTERTAILSMVEEHRQAMLEAWHEYFG